MSACISRDGEYSDHVPGEGSERFNCQRCFAFDEDAALAALSVRDAEITEVRAELAYKEGLYVGMINGLSAEITRLREAIEAFAVVCDEEAATGLRSQRLVLNATAEAIRAILAWDLRTTELAPDVKVTADSGSYSGRTPVGETESKDVGERPASGASRRITAEMALVLLLEAEASPDRTALLPPDDLLAGVVSTEPTREAE